MSSGVNTVFKQFCFNLLWQSPKLHATVSLFDPLHANPPPNGLGLVQVLVLVFSPTPQDTEHELYLPNEDQPPCAALNEIRKICKNSNSSKSV